ncbi:MAG: hypothetical protein JNK27_17685 [Chitinophagaceae bacterium]|nr:hypothetical protein [Chitinophagaceae bacterium]
MSEKLKKSLKEGYNRLKKAVEKIVRSKKEQTPQLVLQPIRNNNRLSH